MPTAKRAPSKLHAIAGGVSSKNAFASKFEIVFEQASDAILTVAAGRFDAVNQAAEEMTGYMRDELVGLPAATLTPDPSKTRVPERTRPLSRELFEMAGTYEDIAILRKDGYVRLVELSVRVIESGTAAKGTLAIAVFRDVTEKKKMERELITKHTELREAYGELEKKNAELQSAQALLVQAGKMAALGELAAGIAHELNQPLQGIRGFAQEMQSGADPADCLKEIVTNVDKMRAIIDYLRTFTRKSTENHEMVDIRTPIDEALKMLSRQFKMRGIEVHQDLGANLPAIYANAMALEQVFINLASNARDAIEATGRGRGNVWIEARADGDFVEICFRDDGIGMDERTHKKIFNPFFTTKEVGKGMGLGLSLSYGMISKLQGSILVESEMGKGTAFRVRVPKDFRELG